MNRPKSVQIVRKGSAAVTNADVSGWFRAHGFEKYLKAFLVPRSVARSGPSLVSWLERPRSLFHSFAVGGLHRRGEDSLGRRK
jgi:hypothetical protein